MRRSGLCASFRGCGQVEIGALRVFAIELRDVDPAFADQPVVDHDHAVQRPEQGADAGGMPPAEMEKLVKAEIAKWAKVVKDAGAKVDN
mgnify:CR=1 FL=1